MQLMLGIINFQNYIADILFETLNNILYGQNYQKRLNSSRFLLPEFPPAVCGAQERLAGPGLSFAVPRRPASGCYLHSVD